MSNNLILKEKLFSTLEEIAKEKGINNDSPITDLMISSEEATKIEKITETLESLNPFPNPLLYAASLLNGTWQLHYSNAREIRSLNSLPLGFKLQQVYQIIDVNAKSFFNIAFVKHSSQLLKGYVKVTATFAPAIDENIMIPQKRLNVNFEKRYVSINKIMGLKTPFFDPIRVFDAQNPPGRIPTLDVTYLDENLRIGRGGEGTLFILSKQKDLLQK
jgi:hypothetical protein